MAATRITKVTDKESGKKITVKTTLNRPGWYEVFVNKKRHLVRAEDADAAELRVLCAAKLARKLHI